jgi:hypothetical protein
MQLFNRIVPEAGTKNLFNEELQVRQLSKFVHVKHLGSQE